MKLARTHLRTAAILGTILVLPFIILELVNRRRYPEAFPIPLFGILWLLPMGFSLILKAVGRRLQTGQKMIGSSIYILLGVALLILIAGLWIGIILDQMPCFLGVPRCD